MTFGQRIRHLREEKQLDRTDAALALGMPYTTYTNYETDQREARHGVLMKFAEFYGVSIDYLLERTDIRNGSLNFVPDNINKTDNQEKTKIIPLLGNIAAGQPLYAEQFIESQLCIPGSWNADFALRIKGESMVGAGIPDGSIVLCRVQEDVDDGQIAVCLVDGEEATLKRIKRYDSLLVLHPENPTMPDLVFRGSDKALVRIMGRAMKVVRDIQ